ncbi:zinc-binding dehydrogenase [Curtobacterium sp. MCBD17_031]|uniref:zinc-binding dehydrogenase n=1 Tax=Curtobacterium sp. MCBD17_031 TaxID=2175671 RepID=UPI0035CF9562
MSGRAWRVRRFDLDTGVVSESAQWGAPEGGYVLVRVLAAGAGLPDQMMAKGLFPGLAAPGFGLGEEVAGIVVRVAPGSRYRPGDRIMGITDFMSGWGGYADYTYVREQSSALVPDGVSDVRAAAFPIAYRTAWVALVERTHVQRGEVLAVLGAGGSSGLAAVQLGKAIGMTVVGIASTADKRAAAMEAGADAVVDAASADLQADLREAVGGRAVDVLFDPVGGAVARAAAAALGRGGRLLVVGLASGTTVPIDSMDLLMRNVTAVGVFAGGTTPEEDEAAWVALTRMLADGELAPVVRKEVPYRDVPAMIREHGGSAGKSVVLVSTRPASTPSV